MSTRKLLIDLEDETEDILKRFPERKDSNSEHVSRVNMGYWGEESLTEDQLTPVFSALNELTELKQLHINFGDNEEALPVHLLTQLIRSAPELSVLCLDSITLSGRTEDFDALALATKQHSSLACVCLSIFSACLSSEEKSSSSRSDFEPSSLALESFLVSLAQTPSLRILELDDVPASKVTLKALFQSKTIQELELWNVPFVNDHLSCFAADLKENTTLRKIEICSCHLNARDGLLLVDILQQNQNLQSAVLEIDWGNIMFGKPIAAILKANRVLTNLHMICVQSALPRNSDSLVAAKDYSAEAHSHLICGALQSNDKLERLTIEFQQSRAYRNDNSRLKKAFAKPLLQVLKHRNHSLQHFALTGGHCNVPVAWNREICFQMSLNQAGRGQWSGKRIMEDLLTIQQEHDLSILFYFLSMHPHLFIVHNEQRNQTWQKQLSL